MVSEKKFLIFLLTVLAITANGCSSRNTPIEISPYSVPVEQVLSSAGKNRIQIENFLNKYRSPEERQAAQFLVANLPPCDRASVSAEQLSENLEYAFLARRSTPWGRDVSWTDFLHYVLPHRVSQEQAANWRKLFYEELLPVVSRCGSMEEAVLAVNLWCFSKTGFQSTQRWDQNPLMTINRGWGRCEEAVILTVCALRSVGIPARQVMVPAWQHSNDNHTWTEVMVDGKWHYIESANPDYGLDHAWFTGSARKAPLVISYAYGQIAHPDFPVMGRPFGCTLINTTARYAPAGKTEIEVIGPDEKAAAGTKVYFSVFNYASFRPVAAKLTDAEGKAEITLGPGSVLVSAVQGNSSAFVGSTWIPGEQAERSKIQLRLMPDNIPQGNIFFRFAYNDNLAMTAPPRNSEGSQKADFEAIKKDRLRRFEGMAAGAANFNGKSAEGIVKAGLNVPEILLALQNCPDEYYSSLQKVIASMDTADLVKITAGDLISNVEFAYRARKEASEKGIRYDDNIFEDFVLNPRIMYEQMRFWRTALYRKFNTSDSGSVEKTLHKIGRAIESLTIIQRGPLGCSLGPLGVLASGTFSSEHEKGIFATAAIRSAGIPARYLDEQGWVEFYDGTDWQPFYPDNSSETGNRNATIASSAYYAPWQTIKFSLPGFASGHRQAQYFKDFTVSRLNNDGYFSIVEKTINGKGNDKDNTWEINIPAEDSYLISAERNKFNEPNISVIRIERPRPRSSKQ
ncbi:transglutaminase domain-containing protein [Maridesulfovibrio sp. FT414]|uniref:transglutaminase-like domain-containing protein n=1 Tax=Maridesulfovibrio sp. FT414 TaxID=2979469 RepID=UPI003D809C18